MSRRSRRGNATRNRGTWLGKAAVGTILAGVVGAGALFAGLRGYLYSEGFRHFLSGKVSEVAQVTGEFSPFRWDGLAVDSAAFRAAGEGMLREVHLDGLHTEVGLGGVQRGVWEIMDSRVQRLAVTVDARGRDVTGAGPQPKATTARKAVTRGWLPSEVELKGLDIQNVELQALLDDGDASVRGLRLRMEPAGGARAYRVELTGGEVRLPFALLPEINLERAKLRWQDEQVFLNSLSASAGTDGRIEATGEWDGNHLALQGGLHGVNCQDCLSPDWAKRLTGVMESDFTVDNRGGTAVARGKLTLRNGTLTALPVLDALAAYADTRRFRLLTLTEARSDWRWQPGELNLSNLAIASEGLVRLEGQLAVRGRKLDGQLRLGLAPGTLAQIPGAETDVFVAGERGLLWAPVHVTGTLDDPKEDLTDRLIAAAGLRMLEQLPETGEKVLKFSRTILGEASPRAIEKGVKIIEESRGIVNEVGGVLGGILGAPPREQPAVRQDAQ